jgi:hypothetical protein
MNRKLFQCFGAALLVETGLIHLYRAPHAFSEVRYIGWLFVLNAAGALLAAALILRSDSRAGWALGLPVTAGAAAAFILSRTVGLPYAEVEAWNDPIGILSLAVEGLYLAAFFARAFLSGRPAAAAPPQHPARMRFAAAVALLLVLVNLSVYQLDHNVASAAHEESHKLTGPLISAQALEDQYGVKVTLVAVTAAGGLVDVRYRVTDSSKALALAVDGDVMPMIHFIDSDTVLMPDSHMRSMKLVDGKMVISLIPNSQHAVRSGRPVIVTFGDVALEPIFAQ